MEIKVTIELTNSKAPPQVYYLSKGDVTVLRDLGEAINCFGGPPHQFFTGAIKITIEGILAKWKSNRRSEMDDDLTQKEWEECEKMSPPNWREAFEQVLAKGGVQATCMDCAFCKIAGVKSGGATANCIKCPFATAIRCGYGGDCLPVFSKEVMDDSDRRVICRYVLDHIGMTVDRDQARNLIAQALKILGKDEAREKFLGKAEPKLTVTHDVSGHGFRTSYMPEVELRFYITRNIPGKIAKSTFAAFRDEETRDFCSEKLNERKP